MDLLRQEQQDEVGLVRFAAKTIEQNQSLKNSNKTKAFAANKACVYQVQELQTQLEQARATNREFRLGAEFCKAGRFFQFHSYPQGQHSIRIIESLLESDMHWFRLQFERQGP